MNIANHLATFAIGAMLIHSLTLLDSAGIKPARLALGHGIYSAHARNLSFPQLRMGLSGLEVEELRRRFAGVADVIAYRVYEAEVFAAARKEFVPVLGFGRDNSPAAANLVGGAVLQQGSCLTQSGWGQFEMVKVDGVACRVESGQWNDAAFRFLTGRQRVVMVRLLDPREAYFHPENRIYEALLIGRNPGNRLGSFKLDRTVPTELAVLSMEEWFWESQGPLVLLLVVLAGAVGFSGLMAMLGLGLAEAAKQREGDRIRSSLGESRFRAWIRYGSHAAGQTLLVSLALILLHQGQGVFLVLGIAFGLSGAWLVGRSVGMGELSARSLMRSACWVQIFTCGSMLSLGVLAQASFEAAKRSKGLQNEGLHAVRLRIQNMNLDAGRWQPALQEFVEARTRHQNEAAYLWPLPMESGTPIEVDHVPARYYLASRAGLSRLGLGCTDLSGIPEGKLKAGVLLSEGLALAALRRNVKRCGKLRRNDREGVQPDFGMAGIQGVPA